ncbi:MAG TPA: DUF1508 domain-containing protein [Spirochaetota bacterium]|nr:DUF1508 domain-containing protein [Spirochaetota bacterium]
MAATFEIYKDNKGEFRFRLRAANGEVIAVSEGYASKESCIKGIDSVRINAATAGIIELNPDRDLVIACDRGDLQGAKKALARGANPNARDSEGEPALKEAVETGNLELVKLMVRHKADINLADIHGETPLHEAADEGHEAIVQYLIKAGATIDPKDNKRNTPLYKALVEGHEKVARILVGAGASTTQINNEGKTPAQIAKEKGIDISVKAPAAKKTGSQASGKAAKKSVRQAAVKKKK